MDGGLTVIRRPPDVDADSVSSRPAAKGQEHQGKGSAMTHRFKRVLLAGLLVLSSLVAAATAVAQPADMRGQLAQSVAALKAKAAASPRASVRVIARLSEAAVSRSRQGAEPSREAPGAYVSASLNTTPALIRTAQDLLLRRMAALGVRFAKRIEGVPMASLDVDSGQLDVLVSTGEVSAVFEDMLGRPTLNISGPLIGADDAHALGARGAGTTIAILDTGVEAPHEFLAGRVLNGACFSTNSSSHDLDTVCPDGSEHSTAVTAGNPCPINGCDHGTLVAGVAAGRSSARFQADGVAPDAKILPVQVFSDKNGTARYLTSDVIGALQHVRQRAVVDNIVAVNLSVGYDDEYTSNCDTLEFLGMPIRAPFPLTELVNRLREMGVATVIASGNNGFNKGVIHPACVSTAITVGATNNNDVIADFSNHSSLVDVLAPGVLIRSSNLSAAGFERVSGTSVAAPHVAGAIAVIRSKVPMSVDQMVALLQATGDPVSGTRNHPARVRINIGRAMAQVAPSGPPTVEIDRRRLIRSSTGRCLDAHGPTAHQNGGRVQVWSCNGNPQQLWTALPNGALRNEAAGLCLEVNGLEIARDGALARLWLCNTSPQQRWTIRPSDSTIKISSGLCLDAVKREQFDDGGRVVVYRCHGESQQKWTFVPPEVLAREANIRTGAGLCLDVHASDVAKTGGRVQVWTCHNKAQQRWAYERNSRAVRLASGFCLDAHLAEFTTKGGRVQTWNCNGRLQQQWTPMPNGSLRNGGGLCLDVHGPDQNKNGGRVQVWPCNGGRQQRFTSNAF